MTAHQNRTLTSFLRLAGTEGAGCLTRSECNYNSKVATSSLSCNSISPSSAPFRGGSCSEERRLLFTAAATSSRPRHVTYNPWAMMLTARFGPSRMRDAAARLRPPSGDRCDRGGSTGDRYRSPAGPTGNRPARYGYRPALDAGLMNI